MKWIKNFIGTILCGIGIALAGASILTLAAIVGTLIIIASPALAVAICLEDEQEEGTNEG